MIISKSGVGSIPYLALGLLSERAWFMCGRGSGAAEVHRITLGYQGSAMFPRIVAHHASRKLSDEGLLNQNKRTSYKINPTVYNKPIFSRFWRAHSLFHSYPSLISINNDFYQACSSHRRRLSRHRSSSRHRHCQQRLQWSVSKKNIYRLETDTLKSS